VEAQLIDPLRESVWEEQVRHHRDATVFHSSAWARVLHETYGHKPCYVLMSVEREPLALVPMMEVHTVFSGLRGVCLPFSDACAPLLSSRFGQDLVVDKLRQIGRERGWRYFEVRDDSILPEAAPHSESYYSHTLDLRAGADPVAAQYSDAAQRAIRKAQRSGLSAEARSDGDAVKEFYRLHVRTRHKHGVPPQPWTFFANIHQHIIATGLGFTMLVKQAGRPIAAAVFFRLGRNAVYKFGASDERFQHFRGNNLCISHAIKVLIDGGAEILDFGRSEKENEGLRRFKLGWGTKEAQICYGKFSLSADSWVGSRSHRSIFYNRVFRALPAPVNRLAGVLLYPHLD
jgi:CelD/BcsL family acetyltransferase involved in cellulose biosynthesis